VPVTPVVAVRAGGQSASRSGLLMDSVIMADNLATGHYSEIDRVIGTLSDLTELDEALRTTLGL
jgi:mRNA-degrading endonuclease toxin of MazEF toxin-antitoxin module